MISDKPGDTFGSILFRHLDRLSFMVQSILYESGPEGAKVFPDDRIQTFYLNLLHMEGLLYPHLDEDYEKHMKEIKAYLFDNRNNIRRDPIGYFIKCQDLLKGLGVQAHNAGFTKVSKETSEFDEEDEDNAEEYKNT